MRFSTPDDRGHERFLAEAADAGIAVEPSELIQFGDKPASRVIGQLAKLAWTGGAATELTHVRAYALHLDLGMCLYVVGFDGTGELPGEFHLRLPGQLRESAAFAKRVFGKKWICEDQEVRARLVASPALAAATRELNWAKHNMLGRVSINVAVQVTAFGEGRSQIVMTSGTYGLLQQDTGIKLFARLARALAPLLVDAKGNDLGYMNTYFHRLPWLDQLWRQI